MGGMIDNLDNRIAYEGGWANWSESVNYNGSIMYLEADNYSTDATVTLAFIGTGIEIFSCTNYDRSYLEVFIDGVSYGKVDTYSASTVRQAKIFTKDDLDDTTFGVAATCNRAQVVTFLYRTQAE